MSIGVNFPILAENLLAEGKYEEALELCREGVEKFPEYSLGKVMLAKALALAGQEDEAKSEAESMAESSGFSRAARKIAQGEKLEAKHIASPEEKQARKEKKKSAGESTESEKASLDLESSDMSDDMLLDSDAEDEAGEEDIEDIWGDGDYGDDFDSELASDEDDTDLSGLGIEGGDLEESLQRSEEVAEDADYDASLLDSDIDELESISKQSKKDDKANEVDSSEQIDIGPDEEAEENQALNDDIIKVNKDYDYNDIELIPGLLPYEELTAAAEEAELTEDLEEDGFSGFDDGELEGLNGGETFEDIAGDRDSESLDDDSISEFLPNDNAESERKASSGEGLEDLEKGFQEFFESQEAGAAEEAVDIDLAASDDDTFTQEDELELTSDEDTALEQAETEEPDWDALASEIEGAIPDSTNESGESREISAEKGEDADWEALYDDFESAIEDGEQSDQEEAEAEEHEEESSDELGIELEEDDSQEESQQSATEDEEEPYIPDSLTADPNQITKDLVAAIKDADYSVESIRGMMDSISQGAIGDGDEAEGPIEMTETIARIFWEQEAYAEAIGAYEKLIEIHPDKQEEYEEAISGIKSEAKDRGVQI